MFPPHSIDITPTRITAAYRLTRQESNVLVHKACREWWGIALKTSGKTHYYQENETLLSDNHHVILLPKGSCYTWKCTEQGESMILNFEALEEGGSLRSIEISDDLLFRNAFERIESALLANDPTSRFEAMQQLYGILQFLSKSIDKKYTPHSQRQILMPAVEYMKENFFDPGIRNEVLAALCDVSVAYFRKCFKNVYGIAPMQYLHNLRLNKAKALLLSDCLSVAEIAESTGYSNPYHFSKMFKAYTGLSPTEYAKSARQI